MFLLLYSQMTAYLEYVAVWRISVSVVTSTNELVCSAVDQCSADIIYVGGPGERLDSCDLPVPTHLAPFRQHIATLPPHRRTCLSDHFDEIRAWH